LTTKNLLEKNRLKSFKVIPINAIISICAYERNKSLKTKGGPGLKFGPSKKATEVSWLRK